MGVITNIERYVIFYMNCKLKVIHINCILQMMYKLPFYINC